MEDTDMVVASLPDGWCVLIALLLLDRKHGMTVKCADKNVQLVGDEDRLNWTETPRLRGLRCAAGGSYQYVNRRLV
jgi:hypothetical protein